MASRPSAWLGTMPQPSVNNTAKIQADLALLNYTLEFHPDHRLKGGEGRREGGAGPEFHEIACQALLI